MPRRRTPSIAYTHVLGPWAAAALVAALVLGLGTYPLAVKILGMAQSQAPWAYLMAAFLLLPILASLLELASASRDRISLYHMARGARRRHLFAVGWLLAAGVPAAAAILIRVLAELLASLWHRILDFGLDVAWLIPAVAFFLFLRLTAGGGERYRARAWLAGFALLAFAALVAWAFFEAPSGVEPMPPRVTVRNWLTSVSLLSVGLWGGVLLLEMRPFLHRPRRTLPLAMGLGWILPTLLTALAMVLVVRHPELITSHWFAEATWGHGVIELSHLAIGLILVGTALVELAFLGQRLWHEMAADAVLPDLFGEQSREDHSAHTATVILCGTAAIGALALPSEILAGLASLSLLASCSTLLLLHIRNKTKDLKDHRLRLPLHPLIPALALSSSIFLIVVLPEQVLRLASVWAALGVLVFLGVAHGRMAEVEREEALIGAGDLGEREDRYRVLVALGDSADDMALLGLAADLAKRRQGEMVALRVLVRDDPAAGRTRVAARREWRRLGRIVAASGIEEVEIVPLVRISPSATEGILESIAEEGIDCVLLGWNAEKEDEIPTVEGVFAATSRSLLVARGFTTERAKEYLVATAGGAHAREALAVADAFAQRSEARVRIVTIPSPGRSREEAEKAISETLDGASPSTPIESAILERGDPETVLLRVGGPEKALLVGASEDQLLGRALLTGLPLGMLHRYPGPALVAKREERGGQFWLRRFWDAFSHPIPAIPPEERAEVFADMRRKATADSDYYILIFLSSVIASLGLVLDSSAVIIGAMLVAPLMSPILALAAGLVHGSVVMVRRAAASTMKGMGVALLTGASTALLLPTQLPTPEILGRGQPSLLDLVVAIASGAAAAYATSRRSLSAALPGVAIAVALVPPLCASGWALGASRFGLAGGALLLFLTNLSAIVLVGATTFLLLGFRPRRAERRTTVQKAFLAAVIAFAVISIPLALQTEETARSRELEQGIRENIERLDRGAWEVQGLELESRGDRLVIRVTVFELQEPSEATLVDLRDRLTGLAGMPVRLEIRVLAARDRILETEDFEAP